MAAKQPAPTSSRRTRDSAQGEMSIGSFRRLEEIGRGSFATVYKAAYSVSTFPKKRPTQKSFAATYGICLHDGQNIVLMASLAITSLC